MAQDHGTEAQDAFAAIIADVAERMSSDGDAAMPEPLGIVGDTRTGEPLAAIVMIPLAMIGRLMAEVLDAPTMPGTDDTTRYAGYV